MPQIPTVNLKVLFDWDPEWPIGIGLLGRRTILLKLPRRESHPDCDRQSGLSVFVLSIAFACNSYSQRSCLACWSHYSSDPRPELNILLYCSATTRDCCFVWANSSVHSFTYLANAYGVSASCFPPLKTLL